MFSTILKFPTNHALKHKLQIKQNEFIFSVVLLECILQCL